MHESETYVLIKNFINRLANFERNYYRIQFYRVLPVELWSMVSYIKGGIQAKGIWKHDPEGNIWAQEGWVWGVERTLQWGAS